MENKTLAYRIYELKGQEKTQIFANRFGLTVSQVSKYETGKSHPSFEVALAMCDYYGCTLDWLIRGIGEDIRKTNIKTAQENSISKPPTKDYQDLLMKNLELSEKVNKLLEEKIEKLEISKELFRVES